MSRALCILGMMRTGTSAVAGLLDLLGAHFGPKDRLLEPNVANPSGFWEHKGVIAVNDELLARLGGSWHAPPAAGPGWHESPTFDDLRARAIELVAADLAAADVWAWKDPRTCLTLPFWDAVVASFLPVICVREPDATARSFSTMGWAAVDGLERPYETGLDLWLAYTTAAFEGTQGRERVVVFYEDLLADSDSQSERLAAFAGLSERLTQETRDEIRAFLRPPRLRHGAGYRLPEPARTPCTCGIRSDRKHLSGVGFSPDRGYTERRGEAFSRCSRCRCGRCGGRRPLGRCDDDSRRVEATRSRSAARERNAKSVQPATKAAVQSSAEEQASVPSGDLERTLPERQGRRELLDEGADGRRTADGEDPPRRLAVLVARSVRVDRTGQCADEDVDSAEVPHQEFEVGSKHGRCHRPGRNAEPRLLGRRGNVRSPAARQDPPRWVGLGKLRAERADRPRLAAFLDSPH